MSRTDRTTRRATRLSALDTLRAQGDPCTCPYADSRASWHAAIEYAEARFGKAARRRRREAKRAHRPRG